MGSLRLNTRIWILVGISWMIGLVASAFLLDRLQTTASSFDQLFRDEVQTQKTARLLQVSLKKQVQEWKDVLIRGADPELYAKHRRQFDQQSEAVRKYASDLRARVDDAETRTMLDEFAAAHHQLCSDYDAGLRLFDQSNHASPLAADVALRGKDRPPTDLVDKIAERMSAHTTDKSSAERAVVATVAVIVAICFVVFLAATLVLVRGLLGYLRDTLSQARDSSAQVAAAAAQVSQSSQSLAQGSSEQAASLQQTTASAAIVEQQSVRAVRGMNSVGAALDSAVAKIASANSTLHGLLGVMDDMHESSKKMSTIIKLIDEIAFQTNILALNAAVEAARAGSAGSGFAVVADAARDIGTLIAESTSKVATSRDSAQAVGREVDSVTAETDKNASIVKEVSLGSVGQRQGVEQIARALSDIGKVTQITAAASEESAAAAEQLTAQASILADSVERLATLAGVN